MVLLFVMAGSLAACDTAEERAEKHYQTALELIEQGEPERAIVEFRNVFELNPEHVEARLAFARLLEEGGDPAAAAREYLQVAERQPENAEARRALALLAAQRGDWQEAERHVGPALEATPEDPALRAVSAGLAYASALEARDDPARRAAAEEAAALLAEDPDRMLLHRVVIDDALRRRDLPAALTATEAAIAAAPQERQLYMQRLAVLTEMGEDGQVEQGLIDLIETFPDDPAHRGTLVRWYASRGEIDKAEAQLREAIPADDADADADSDPGPRLTLINFLRETRGPEAALAELEEMIAGGADHPIFRVMRAGFRFDAGEHDAAIAEMREVIDAATEATDETRTYRVTLAQMHDRQGDSVTARSIVEEVLAEDAGHVEALKLKAGWLIEDDKPGEAISLLRRALDESPQDASIMTLMARAYERSGDPELMAEMLSLAVEASNKAPAESVRYAALLARQGKYLPAESVLIDALRLSRDNPQLLEPLGRVYLAMEDWGRADGVIKALEGVEDPQARAAARALRAAMLEGQGRVDETIQYLEGLAEGADGEQVEGARLAILRTHLAAGRMEEAKRFADELLAEDPEDASRRFIHATVQAAAGDAGAAEATYRALLEEDPNRLRVWTALHRLLTGEGRLDEAEAAMEAALEAMPEATDLLWIRAGDLEAKGDIDGAIAIYEQLYQRDTDSTVLANNYASLLASYRAEDPASLDRAFAVARRLKGTDFPPFQDTYGWLIHLRGDSREALSYMEPAAEAMPDDPLVQYHLAEIYAANERPEDALAQYRRVLELAGSRDPAPDFVTAAREAVARLEAGDAEEGTEEEGAEEEGGIDN